MSTTRTTPEEWEEYWEAQAAKLDTAAERYWAVGDVAAAADAEQAASVARYGPVDSN